MLWPIVGGGVLAVLLGRWGDRLARIHFGTVLIAIVGPARHAALALGRTIEGIDSTLRQWPAAALAVLVLAILFGAALLT
jgi:hypothetical protein